MTSIAPENTINDKGIATLIILPILFLGHILFPFK